MEKYKVCPYCGRHNLPKMLECIQCETDLSNVRVVDEDTENKKTVNKKVKVASRMIRLCDCGFKNAVNARKCGGCGEDISDIIPTEDEGAEQTSIHCVITSLDGEYAYEIVESSFCIGREAGMSEYLAMKPYVSRQHAELIKDGDKFYIRNMSQTNFTYLNNMKISQEMCELHDGDEIGLGGNSVNGNRQQDAAYFQVRMGSCM